MKNYEIASRNLSCVCQKAINCQLCTGQEMQFSRIIEDKTSKIKTKPKTQTSEPRHDKETTKRFNTKILNTSENGALPLDLNSKLAGLKNLKTYDQLKTRCQKF